MPTLVEILNDPNYVNANAETKRAIFDKHAPQDPNYAGANDATKQAIRQRFGVADAAPAAPPPAPSEVPTGRRGPLTPQEVEIEAAKVRPNLDLLAGGIRGAGSIGATGLRIAQIDTKEENEQRRRDMDAALQSLLGADPTSFNYSLGKLGMETAGTLGAGRFLAFFGKGLPAIQQALRTGGIGAQPAGYGTRVAAGGLTGVAAAGMVNPEDAVTGGAIGAAIPGLAPVVVPAVRGAYRGVIEPLVQPGRTAANELLAAMGGKADEAVNALRTTQDMATTPGFRPTLTERLIEGGGPATPTVAAMERRLGGVNPEMNREVWEASQQRIGALQAQLGRINADIERKSMLMTPAARAEMESMRSQILRSLDDEVASASSQQGTLQAAGRAVAERLPANAQLASGEVLAARAAALRDETKRTVVQPAYTAAMKAAGNTPIVVNDLIAEAERILGKPLSGFAPETRPDAVASLLRMRPAAPPPRPLGRGEVAKRVIVRGEAPATDASATLEQLDALRKSINADVTRAARGQGQLDATTAGNLMQLHRKIDEVIAGSTSLSDDAKALYGEALAKYRDMYAPRFKEGVTGRLLKPGTFGETRVLPEDSVAKYLSDETSARQFITTFGNDPQAMSALRTGVADLFRARVVDPATKMVKPEAAAKFLQDNAAALNRLEQSGLNVRQLLEQTQREAATIASGLDNLKAAGASFKKGSASEMVDYMLQNTTNMNAGRQRLDLAGKAALASEVADRANSLLKAGDPAAALSFLNKNKETARLAMGDKKYDDLLKMADIANQTKTLLASMPKDVKGAMPTMLRGYSVAELFSLERVARDIKRMDQVTALANQGMRTPSPRVGDITGDITAEGVVNPQRINFLSRAASFARNVWEGLERKVNARAAAELGVLMHQDPDAAIQAIRDAQLRAQRKTAPAGTAALAAARTATIAPASQNQLAPQPINALAP